MLEPFSDVKRIRGLAVRARREIDGSRASVACDLDRAAYKEATHTSPARTVQHDDILDPGADARGDAKQNQRRIPNACWSSSRAIRSLDAGDASSSLRSLLLGASADFESWATSDRTAGSKPSDGS